MFVELTNAAQQRMLINISEIVVVEDGAPTLKALLRVKGLSSTISLADPYDVVCRKLDLAINLGKGEWQNEQK